MKKLAHFIFVVLTLGALGWALWRGFHQHPEAGHGATAEAPAAAEESEEHEEFAVKLEKEKWKAMGIEMTVVEKAEVAPKRVAYGRVLDPAPLLLAESDLAIAESALAASKADFERSQKLLATGENTSRKAAETAEAQYRADELKTASLRRATQLQWGGAIASLEAGKRRAFVDKLAEGSAALIRVDAMAGDVFNEAPSGARLVFLGREQQPVESKEIFVATTADARTQAEGFLVRVESPPFPMRPGMTATAWLQAAAKPRAGFAVPRSAILRHDGRPWVYVQEEEEKFVRRPILLESPLDGERGWFVAEGGEIKADELVVVTGAQVLLSEELKAASGAAEEE